jgi:hypothetical protein
MDREPPRTVVRWNAPSIGAVDLHAAYRANSKTASQRYGKAVTVSGTVASLDFGETGSVTVNLGGKDSAAIARADMVRQSWPEALKLAPGQALVLHCIGSYPANDLVKLRGCRLAAVRPLGPGPDIGPGDGRSEAR